MDIEKISKNVVRENIELTEIEKDIFGIFTDFVKEKNLKTTIRVAGGWVRDKVNYIPAIFSLEEARFLERTVLTSILL